MGKKKQKISHKQKLLLAFVLFFIFVCGCFYFVKTRYINTYDAAADSASTVAIRSMIINAVEGLKQPAPIDAKTGDIYFPESTLMLPLNPDIKSFQYSYQIDAEHGAELSITTKSVLAQAASPLYGAMNVDQVLEAVPKLQACQRGVRVYDSKIEKQNSDLTFMQSIETGNGKIVYMYYEKACFELEQLKDALSTIRAY